MMKYLELTLQERVLISHLLKQGFRRSEVARQIGRHRSTRPRKRRGFKTPEEILYGKNLLLLHFKLDTKRHFHDECPNLEKPVRPGGT
jgi:IS30 family transposase